MAKLTFVLEDGQEVVVPVGGRISLGRESGNDVVVDDPRISEKHAELLQAGSGFEVCDLNSEAGTFINGSRVERHPLTHGDRIAFGPLVGLFQLEDAELAEAMARASRQKPAKAEPAQRKSRARESSAAASAADEAAKGKIQEQLDAARAELEILAAQKAQIQSEVEVARHSHADEQRNLGETRTAMQKATTELLSLEEHRRSMAGQLEKMQALIADLDTRVKGLQQEEARLGSVKESLRDAEQKHADWVEAVRVMSGEHEHKQGEVQRLTAVAANALREVETMSAHKEELLDHLRQMGDERTSLDAHMTDLRKSAAALETRCEELKTLAGAREDQVATAEKKLETIDRNRTKIESHIAELKGVEARLEAALANLESTQSEHAALNETLKVLHDSRSAAEREIGDLEGRIGGLRDDQHEMTRRLEETRAAHQNVGELLSRIHAERESHESGLAATRRELIAERQRLDEVKAKRAEIEKQCEELASTGRKLEATRMELSQAEETRTKLDAAIKQLEDESAARKAALEAVCGEEDAAKGRVEVLRGRERDLRGELENLSESERAEREKFEELRKLALEMEGEHEKQKKNLSESLESTRHELADLEMKLAPLRDWKEGMDRRYAKLAALPEDSAEARDLWREIENEKASLKSLITQQAGQTKRVSLREAVLKNLTIAPADESAAGSKGKLHAPPALSEDADTPEERANVGAAGTGAMYSGAGQEMALKARLNRLRESVQREAVRLEFLRQERAREETRGKTGSAGESMMREQERQLETKIRRDEERFATVQRKLELAEVEEEKRREKVAEMEQKIAELRADIAEAERQRSDFRHQADLAHTELKNLEAMVDRVRKMSKAAEEG